MSTRYELLAAHGIVLDQRDLDTLVARTEGWTAGVRLSAIRMEGAESPGEFVTELAMDQGSVGEYLMDEVLKRQPKPVRKLLIRTSFLDEVTGPLADAVTGMEGCAELLAKLARTNSFVIPLDAAQTRFRYHQLLAEMLRYLLRRESNGTASVIYARAAAWYEANHNPLPALRWALRAGDAALIAEILSRGMLARAFVYRYDVLASGLRDALPILTSDGVNPAHLAVSRAVIAAARPGEPVADDIASASAALPQETTTDVDLHVTANLAKLVLGQRVGAAETVHSAANRLLSRDLRHRPSLDGSLTAAVLLADVSMHMWDGEFTDVEDTLGAALAIAETNGPRNLELEILGTIALLDTYWCRPNRADSAAHRAREILQDYDGMEPPATLGLAAALRSLIAADFTGLGQALQRTLVVDAVGSDPGVVGVLTLARSSLLIECGEFHAARVLLHESRECVPRQLLAARRDMLLADSDTAQGRPQAALTVLQRYRRTRFDELVAPVRARAYLTLGDLSRAEQCARTVLTGSSPQISRYQTIEAMLCDAEVALRRDDTSRSLEVLVGALEIADRVVVLPFAQANNTFAELMDHHPEVAAEWPVPPLAPPRGEHSLLNSIPPLVDPLTERERTVVRFLATSMSTAEIAGELCISVNTVKTHLAAIYRKLAARKRREAVLRARELELL